MLENIKDIGVSNWIGLVSIVVAIFIGVKSIRVAKGALEHSQRSLIVNESYKPIINDINNYRNLKLYSSQLLDFSEIKAVKNGYIFDALEEDWKQKINKILEKENSINKIKKSLEGIASNAICEVINKYIEKTDYEEEVGNIQFKMKGSKLYDVLMSNNLHYLLVDSYLKPEIYCEIWVEHIENHSEAGEISAKRPEYILPIEQAFEKYMNISLDPNNELPEFDINNIEKQIMREINNNSKHIMMENERTELIKIFNILQDEINERIRELIIPGHKKKRKTSI
ncbi:hypothetical protein [Bacillus cereus]|uniref:hypothetical protein n=2 Tax=Bacillus cereus group TaxID=86661 RepID=UPI000BEB81DC|nr:hypothetical protein [Bacillus cereus]PED29448.1 hypothetical protein CON13_25310 [Bacillus cereus]PEE50280.1 hypothetical protein COM80_25980 [Bacillus cereus]PFL96695.1 hypothetical protein COJ35_08685 [Bacillus cereus]PFV66743.1 hypothetical protein COL16_23775 [Bacillus cereus]PGS40022.1 hypothetical protein COC56_01145 [Bacillus cereus]